MTSDQLNAFVATVDAGSFSGAARQLYMTPQAVMHQVTSLEGELGFKLLLRGARGVSATPAGSGYYDSARQLLALMVAARDQGKSVAAGRAQLCFAHCQGRLEHNHCLLELATAVSAEHPEYVQRHVFEEQDPLESLRMVAEGAVDLLEWIEEPNVAAMGLGFARVSPCSPYALVAAAHPLAGMAEARGGTLDLRDLDGFALSLSSRYWFARLGRDLATEAPRATVRECGCDPMGITNACMNQGVFLAWDIPSDDVPPGIVRLRLPARYDGSFGFAYATGPDGPSRKVADVLGMARRLFG